MKPFNSNEGNFFTNSVIVIEDQPKISILRASASDVVEVTELLHGAFKVWTDRGLILSPAIQTEAQTLEHLLPNGFVLKNKDALVGTFSLERGSLIENGQVLKFREGDAWPVDFFKANDTTCSTTDNLLVFRKLAIAPELASIRIGSRVYGLIESYAKKFGYNGLIIETVREAHWLFAWYLKLGFKVVGEFRYPGSKVNTVLMSKLYSEFTEEKQF